MPSRVALAVAASLALAAAHPVAAGEPESGRHADIRRLLALTGAGSLGVQTAQQMMVALRPLVPQAPESFWAEFSAKLDPDELVEMLVPIYAKHLGDQDVKDLIAFFESPAGRKLSRVQPLMMQESMAAGQAWGRRIAESLVRRARERGWEVKDL